MPVITPDFSEAAERLDVLPAGTYKTRITGCEEKVSKAGNPYLNWKLQVFGAEGDLKGANNMAIFYATVTTGAAAGRLRDFIKAAIGEVPAQFDTDALIGREVITTVAEGKNADGTPSRWPEVKNIKGL